MEDSSKAQINLTGFNSRKRACDLPTRYVRPDEKCGCGAYGPKWLNSREPFLCAVINASHTHTHTLKTFTLALIGRIQLTVEFRLEP